MREIERIFGRRRWVCQSLIPALALLASNAANADAVGEFRATLGKWVETRRIESEEDSDWKVEREILEATRALLEKEKEVLEAEVAELESTNTAADAERTGLLDRQGELQRSSQSLEDRIREMEVRVRQIARRLPEPLVSKLDILLVQIPADDSAQKPPLGQRLMTILGVLAQADKFNGTATFVAETRDVGDGTRIAVRTLYWGLAQAVYVDAQRRFAGLGHPGPDGWEFSVEPELVDRAARLLDIYEGHTDVIEFVDLPVRIY